MTLYCSQVPAGKYKIFELKQYYTLGHFLYKKVVLFISDFIIFSS